MYSFHVSRKADFIQDITTQFGPDVEFHACSASGMNIEEAYDFLLQRGKISLHAEEAVGIAPDMTMCD